MNNPVKLVDAAERELALDVNHSLIVEAPAGSGKTTLLTQRFLRLLSLSETPESIVAITFSRKAAEEMRTRIVDALSDAEQGESTALDPVSAKWASAALSNAKKKQWGLDVNPRRLRILTIDALAHLIVRRHPLSVGVAGTQQIVETWLMERCHTPRERRYALGIHVDSCDVVPQLRHGRCVDCAEIAAANDRKFHPITLDARPGVAGGPVPRGLSPRLPQQFLLPSRRQAPVGDQARRDLPTAHGFSPGWG